MIDKMSTTLEVGCNALRVWKLEYQNTLMLQTFVEFREVGCNALRVWKIEWALW